MRKSSSNNHSLIVILKRNLILFVTLISFYGCNSSPAEHKLQEDQNKNIIVSNTDSIQNNNKKNGYSCNYLNEQLPTDIPVIFSEGFVSTNVDESSFEINRQGDAMIFARNGDIQMITYNNGRWSSVFRAPFSSDEIDGECCFSPNGNRIYFGSRRLAPDANNALNTWYSEKTEMSWSDAIPLKSSYIDQRVHAVSISSKGNIYFSGLNKFQKYGDSLFVLTNLTPPIKGSHPFIAPDESYIIFSASAPNRRDTDLYISYKGHDDTWGNPIHLDSNINTKSIESNPFISPDGKYLFFIRKYDVYWVKADFLDHIRINSTNLE